MSAHCSGKTQYPTFKHAEKQAKRSSRKHDEPMQPYHCQTCNRFHFGNSSLDHGKRKPRE